MFFPHFSLPKPITSQDTWGRGGRRLENTAKGQNLITRWKSHQGLSGKSIYCINQWTLYQPTCSADGIVTGFRSWGGGFRRAPWAQRGDGGKQNLIMCHRQLCNPQSNGEQWRFEQGTQTDPSQIWFVVTVETNVFQNIVKLTEDVNLQSLEPSRSCRFLSV